MGMMDKMPGMGNMGAAAGQMDVAEKQLGQTEAVIKLNDAVRASFPDKLTAAVKAYCRWFRHHYSRY